MARTKSMNMIWAFGLSEQQAETLRSFLGNNYQLHNWLVGVAPSLVDYEGAQPCIAILTPDAMKSLMELPELAVRHLELLPQIMMLDEEYTQAELEYAVDSAVAEIIRPPYTKAKLAEKLRRAMEIEAVHTDVLRMSKEIILEREILERKNNTLNFLVGFLTSTSLSMNPSDIIEMVADKFKLLFPVRSVHAATWNCKDHIGETDVFISSPESHESFKAWTDNIRDAVQRARPDLALTMNVSPIDIEGLEDKWRAAMPADGHVITLPISMDDIQFGVLMVLTDTVRSLSRDQAMAMNSALRHLALTLKNAQHFITLKQHANHDGLTGLFNRRNFDKRIQDEVDRANRYGYPLAVIFADLDHFKDVNDTRGHHAGDTVLREFAALIGQTRRSSDYVARYGGEEFIIVLPHTDIKQAHSLAERLRKQVAKHRFDTGNGTVRITTSQGVADLNSISDKNAESLIGEADKALYRAKLAGRNRTVSCDSNPAQVAV